jgi:hypothetical protein
MLAYAARTGIRQNRVALRNAGWRLIVSAAGVLRHEGFPYALDNGAWAAYQQGRPFDERLLYVAFRLFGAEADWTVLPDQVCGGHASLDLSLRWMRRVVVHDWLRHTSPCNMILAHRDPHALLRPQVQQQVVAIMRQGKAEATPDDIHWQTIVDQWELPFPTKIKRSPTNEMNEEDLAEARACRCHPGPPRYETVGDRARESLVIRSFLGFLALPSVPSKEEKPHLRAPRSYGGLHARSRCPPIFSWALVMTCLRRLPSWPRLAPRTNSAVVYP